MKRPYSPKRIYVFRTGKRMRRRWIVFALICVVMLVFSLVKLAGYGADLAASRRISREIRNAYHSVSPVPDETETAGIRVPPAASAPETPAPGTSAPDGAAPAAPSAEPVLSSIPFSVRTSEPHPPEDGYPGNPDLVISSRFKSLRRQYRYIAGWLSINGLIDEPVMQRNNSYYIDHDPKGNKNVNGAIFMDAGVRLETRPRTIILYGHNMKSGAMFGSLRNYENLSFYHKDPFLTFDSLYEPGHYVVFAAGKISMNPDSRHYLDFFNLLSSDDDDRKAMLDALAAASVHTCTVDVRTDDQILLLVTCNTNDAERRVVAARRIREGEKTSALKKTVKKSRKRR